ncbi:MAG: class I SAM-dependent methyltransferase [Firmicutes bacterium]|nr:class I SAM-dependent methyltransferase [Bacillota bacterium]
MKVYATDIDSDCRDYIGRIDEIHNKIKFIEMDVKDLSKYFDRGDVDYLVSRDVFMFVEDTEKYFDDITSIVKKGIRQMGCYMKENKRMKNKITPVKISKELEKRGWKVEIEYLNWYKGGYFIKADK